MATMESPPPLARRKSSLLERTKSMTSSITKTSMTSSITKSMTEGLVEKARRKARTKKNETLAKIFGRGKGNGEMLWGLLHIKIVKCERLRDMDGLRHFNLGRLTRGTADKSDPYIEAFIQNYRLLKTRCHEDDMNPVFDEEFFCPVAHYTEGIIFNVMDKDVYIDEHLGKYFLPVSDLIKPVNDDDLDTDLTLAPGDLKRVGMHKIVKLSSVHKIVKLGAKKIRDHGTLEFMIEFIPTRLLPKTPEVPGLYFSPTKCNDVKLYMNADDDGSAPVIRYGGQNDDEKVWKPPRMWRDVYDAICNAEQFIYLVGWSFDTDQYLLRGDELTEALADNKYSPKLGELLKIKAEEGVVVNLMQWDDFSSNSVQQTGKMGTCDEKTKNFFRGTKVNARFMGMAGGETNTILQGTSKRMVFTHHQKFIIMDAPKVDDDDDKSTSKRMNKSHQLLHGGERELLAFVGGIDLTTGRWDNRQHPLFRSLQSQHIEDFYRKCFDTDHLQGPLVHGPRQPWHDIHSSVRGPEAIHLVRAFEERWSKQAESKLLVTLRNLGYNDAKAAETKGGWCAQLSRSIDSNVNDFKQREEAQDQEKDFVSKDSVDWSIISDNDALLSRRFEALTFDRPPVIKQMSMKKGRLVETSIHKTNIHQIRRAKHFIYIESQYFMGSSFMWGDNRHVKCGNLIAAEVALKICEKIAAREPFAVYILLPMWMEGIPTADATQGLLYFQRMTIEALYKQVDDALNTRMATSSDSGLKVSDYLNLYCLGTRETVEGSQATAHEPITEDEKVLKQTRRHQIYIHSKMMIVDDDVVQVGTANINQRSMDGCRDSEIMMTAWQPDHLATDTSIAKSDIHAYRMHIWASLTGEMHDEFRNPSSKECVKVMNSIAQRNWATYIGKETVDMKSHLLPFPIDFVNGKITPRKGLVGGDFPDTKASVLGKKSLLLPELLLT